MEIKFKNCDYGAFSKTRITCELCLINTGAAMGSKYEAAMRSQLTTLKQEHGRRSL